VTEAELRALGDPWIDWFLSEQQRLRSDMSTYNLMHMAGSFGRPGSMTEGGIKYRAASFERDLVDLQLMLYALIKGYIKLEDLDASVYDKPPKKTVNA